MKLSDYLKTTTQSALAKQVGVSQGMVHQWVTGLRPVSPDKCILIERATNRAVTCEELLPDFDWQYLRTPKSKVVA
jgi:DNA-binding transcriptional regulator YdaS (Cro superfamily)